MLHEVSLIQFLVSVLCCWLFQVLQLADLWKIYCNQAYKNTPLFTIIFYHIFANKSSVLSLN